jgi:acetyltransferase
MLLAMEPRPDAGGVAIPLVTGEQAILRPIRPDDAPRLQALVQRLSPETRYRRFFSHRRTLPAAAAARFAQVDAHARLAIVAERPTPAGPELIGVARCDVVDPAAPQTASVAMVVEDRFQHAGLGRALLRVLVAAARAQGITRFAGDVLTENHPVLAFLRDAGFPVTLTGHGAELHFTGEIGRDTATHGETGPEGTGGGVPPAARDYTRGQCDLH